MKTVLSAAALAVLLVPAASAQLVHSYVAGPPWKVAQQHLSTSTITPTATTTSWSHLAADEASGVLYLVGVNGSNRAIFAWPYGAPAPVLVGDLVLDGVTQSSGVNIQDIAFAAGKLYVSRFNFLSTIYEVDPSTATGVTWFSNGAIDVRGIAYDPVGDRFVVGNSGICNTVICTGPAGLYSIDRVSQAFSFLTAFPVTGKADVITVGGGRLWGTGTVASVLANFDLVGGTWDATPPSTPSPSFFVPGLEWAPGFLTGCAGVVYCTAGTSTNGCLPSMCASGVASASSPSGYTLTVSGADGQRAGLVMYGVSGPLASPWSATSTSYRCIANPVQRMGTQNSGGTAGACNGVYTEDWNLYRATHPGALGQPFGGGETAWAQAWYRDPAASKSSGLTNGIEFYVMP